MSHSEPQIAIGLMSGTSLDGVDVSAAQFGPSVELIAQRSLPIGPALRDSLLWLATGEGTPPADAIDALGEARRELTDYYAQAALELPESVLSRAVCIGAHGQTIRHRPERQFTLQILDGARLAQATGLPVVCDLRSADVALGGQGAPLVPPFHLEAFAALPGRSAVVNVGGIANVTILETESSKIVAGFDTGPGNRLLDDWIAQCRQQPFDANGQWAAGGTVSRQLLTRLLNDPYFARKPPKSTGREDFNLAWLSAQLDALGAPIGPQDTQATLLALTVESIAAAIEPYQVDRIILCGGGARNGELVARLAARCAPTPCAPCDRFAAIDPQAMESLAFAWLGWRRWLGLIGNAPDSTGATSAAILGALHLPARPRSGSTASR